jgi:hypothetical protein
MGRARPTKQRDDRADEKPSSHIVEAHPDAMETTEISGQRGREGEKIDGLGRDVRDSPPAKPSTKRRGIKSSRDADERGRRLAAIKELHSACPRPLRLSSVYVALLEGGQHQDPELFARGHRQPRSLAGLPGR